MSRGGGLYGSLKTTDLWNLFIWAKLIFFYSTKFLGHHLQHAQQMAMSLGGIGGVPHQGSSSAEALTSPSSNMTKRERKRKSENKGGNAIVHPPLNLNGHAMTRDERKAMTLGLPISVAVS